VRPQRFLQPDHPINIMSPAPEPSGARTEIRQSARAHNTRIIDRAHAPPANRSTNTVNLDPALDAGSLRSYYFGLVNSRQAALA
jgi:hypothetical protein